MARKVVKKPKKSHELSEDKPARISRHKSYLPWLTLLFAAFLLYGQSINYEYVLDDKLVISENSIVKQGLKGIPQIFSTESFTGYFGEQQDLVAGARYRPLSLVTFAIEQQFFGLSPAIQHFTNIVLYALTGILLYHLFLLLLPLNSSRWFLSLPFLAALFFILHPVHSEAVANIKGRDEILCLLLSLFSLYTSLAYFRAKNLLWLFLTGIIFLLALLSKENAITFLLIIPLSIYFFRKIKWKSVAPIIICLLISAGIYILIRFQVIGYFLDSGREVNLLINNPFLEMNSAQKLATIAFTLLLYLKLLFFPHPLTPDYNPYHIPIMEWSDPIVWVSILIFGWLIYAALRGFSKKTIFSWAILYFLITISLVSNILFPVGSFMNERFLFMPSVSFCLLLPWLLTQLLPQYFQNRAIVLKASWVVLCLLITAYSLKTITQVPIWKNPISLIEGSVRVSKNSARANAFMAYEYYRKGLSESDPETKYSLFRDAELYVDKALSIYPAYADALTTKGGLLGQFYTRDKDLEKLLDGFYKVIAAGDASYTNTFLEYLNQRADSQRLAAFYYQVGIGLFCDQRNDYNRALKYLNYGYKVSPEDALILSGMCKTLFYLGSYDKSINFGLSALGRLPDHPETSFFTGMSYKKSGNEAQSRYYLEQAYAVKPELRSFETKL